jgi:hypothetical protein
MYKDRFGVTKILGDNLQISWDYDDNEHDLTQRKATLLYTPDMGNTNTHYHISLDQLQAKNLREWLDEFIADISRD